MIRATAASRERLSELGEMVEQALGQALPAADDPALTECFATSRLVESMRYSMSAPGKRLRPLLALATSETLGHDPATLLRFATGIELIHAYSLIHDDLPAMDDDDLRRGLATNHVVYGDGIAILAGDGLLTHAMVVMLEPLAEPGLQMRVVAEIARAAGFEGMVGGQAADLLAEGMKPEEALLRSIHERKTGALITASVRAGALLSGAGGDEMAALDRFAERYGLAFQIGDDIKDEVAPIDVSGKNPGGDKRAGKMTYPGLLGIAASRVRLEKEIGLALDALAPLGERAALLKLLALDSIAVALDADGA